MQKDRPCEVRLRLRMALLYVAALAALIPTINCVGSGSGSSPVPPPLPAAAKPTFWPVQGSFSPPQTVSLADATVGATIYYTTDGSTPSTSSAQYTGPISITSSAVFMALATAQGFSPSAVVSCSYNLQLQNGVGPTVSAVLTTDDKSHLMSPQSSFQFTTASGGNNIVDVDENQTYQQIEGFGAAFTDSAAYLLHEVATPTALATAMNDLFARQGTGIGLSFMRNPMGASDLARSIYSFDDIPAGQTDFGLANFSIAHDQIDIIPLIQQAEQLNPQLEIVASPWSPPAWMKNAPAMETTPTMDGGTLIDSSANYNAFANYFIKYIQAYEQAGIAINYITLQNEPGYDPSTNPAPYPGMLMDAPTQTTLMRDYVLPALVSSGLNTKVLGYDFNWDNPEYPEAILSDSTLAASSQVAGIAWHGYAGTPGVMTTVQNLFPAKGTFETEHTGSTQVSDQIKSDFEEITQVMRNWGKTYVKWSLALDQSNGPHTGGCGTCTPIVTVNTGTGGITYGLEYYTLGHFSKYVLPGANRVYSSNATGIVTSAFVNPDGSIVLVTYNDVSYGSQTFEVQWGTQSFTYTLPPLSGATFTWSGTQNGGYTVDATSVIQASNFNSTLGLQTETTNDITGGYDLGYANDGDYAGFKNVAFGSSGVSSVSARLACDQTNGGNCGGALEFHLDSPTGTLLGSLTVPATGGWQTWTTVSGTLSGATGVHDVYILFKAPPSGITNLGNLNWFQFT